MLAQLQSELTDDQFSMMTVDQDIYMGLAQLAADYEKRNTVTENIWAQVNTGDEDDMNEWAEMLAQMNQADLEELQEMLSQTDTEV